MMLSHGQCRECGGFFVKFREEKRYCSNACRMRHNRQVQKKKLDYLERLVAEPPKLIGPDLFA